MSKKALLGLLMECQEIDSGLWDELSSAVPEIAQRALD
jgi:hypothetical protein